MKEETILKKLKRENGRIREAYISGFPNILIATY